MVEDQDKALVRIACDQCRGEGNHFFRCRSPSPWFIRDEVLLKEDSTVTEHLDSGVASPGVLGDSVDIHVGKSSLCGGLQYIENGGHQNERERQETDCVKKNEGPERVPGDSDSTLGSGSLCHLSGVTALGSPGSTGWPNDTR